MVDAIGREHGFRPIEGDVLFVGRQTVYFTPEELATHLRDHVSSVDRDAIEIDASTVNRFPGYAGKQLATDRSIFRALGVRSIKAIDVSSYEGAEIVHDLNRPLPDHLAGTADFLVDGSTLDNVFDPAMALRNYAALLRPGGRLITINGYNTRETAYTISSPPWYLDFFVENGFADCKVYVGVIRRGRTNAFWLDVGYVGKHRKQPLRFHANAVMFVLVFAEKAGESTADRIPIQHHYRSEEAWSVYAEKLARIEASQRPHLMRSTADLFLNWAYAAYPWIDRNFQPQRHWRQIPHRTYGKARDAYWKLAAPRS